MQFEEDMQIYFSIKNYVKKNSTKKLVKNYHRPVFYYFI